MEHNIPDIKRVFIQNHKKIDFTFTQNKFDFIVEEIPNRVFSENGTGNYLILKIQKEWLSTWDLIGEIAEILDIDEHKIGYAGLKDKNATTTQYISIPLIKEKYLKGFTKPNIKILAVYKDKQGLNIGDLAGNKFTITLKDVQKENLNEIYAMFYQRFKNMGFQTILDIKDLDKIIIFKKLKRSLMGKR